MCVHRIMAITSAFQADDAGSIPAARSNLFSCFTNLNALKINALLRGFLRLSIQ